MGFVEMVRRLIARTEADRLDHGTARMAAQHETQKDRARAAQARKTLVDPKHPLVGSAVSRRQRLRG